MLIRCRSPALLHQETPRAAADRPLLSRSGARVGRARSDNGRDGTWATASNGRKRKVRATALSGQTETDQVFDKPDGAAEVARRSSQSRFALSGEAVLTARLSASPLMRQPPSGRLCAPQRKSIASPSASSPLFSARRARIRFKVGATTCESVLQTLSRTGSPGRIAWRQRHVRPQGPKTSDSLRPIAPADLLAPTSVSAS